MRDEQKAFISYIDEKNIEREGFVIIIRFDSSFVEFKTSSGNNIILPTCRILKIKYKDEVEEDE